MPDTGAATQQRESDSHVAQNSRSHSFRARVAMGTFLGVVTCLFFAALLMLVLRLPPESQSPPVVPTQVTGSETEQQFGVGVSSTGETQRRDPQAASGVTEVAAGSTVGREGSPSNVAKNAQDKNDAVVVVPQQDVTDSDEHTVVARQQTAPQRAFTVPSFDQRRITDDGPPHESQLVNAPPVDVPTPEGMFEGRDQEQRKKLVESEGGNAASEAAVERGLQWLAKHQAKDGRWSLHGFHTTRECDGRCTRPGSSRSDTAATGLALLPFLGAGETPHSGHYRVTVREGLSWLIRDQLKSGTFSNCGTGTLYAHGIATIALCEAWSITKDKRFKGPAQRAVDFMVKAQHPGGGWRYQPRAAGDTSVTGWQVIAIRSAQQGGLRVPKSVLPRVSAFLDSVQVDSKGSGYRYIPRGRITEAMTAEGLLCRIYTSWNSKQRGLEAGVQYLLSHPPRSGGELYYWYYATQVMHHYGGEPWGKWNPQMRNLLINLQSTTNHESGSWAPMAGHDSSGGRVYATSLALLTLEVYYRHKRVYADQ